MTFSSPLPIIVGEKSLDKLPVVVIIYVNNKEEVTLMTDFVKYLDGTMVKMGIKSGPQLALRIGVSQAYAHNIIRGIQVPGDDVCVKIAELAGDDAARVIALAHMVKATSASKAAWDKIFKAVAAAALVLVIVFVGILPSAMPESDLTLCILCQVFVLLLLFGILFAPKRLAVYFPIVTLLLFSLAIAGCGEHSDPMKTQCGGDVHAFSDPTIYSPFVSDVTVHGDSMSHGCAGTSETDYWLSWGVSVENDGVSSTTIEWELDPVHFDARHFKTLVVWMGYNDIKHPEITPDNVVALYLQALTSWQYDKVVCVGIPFGSFVPNDRIQTVNDGIKSLCSNFVDASDVPVIDGIHPTPEGYATIGARINAFL